MAFALLNRIFGQVDPRESWRTLYAAIVAEARQPHWYRDAGVEDSIDGRFEMICLVTSVVLIRMEALGEPAAEPMALLTEVLVEDMEGQVREIGFGDLVVGKHVGQMMGALGGRIGAYRSALVAGGNLDAALIRNLYRGQSPAETELARAAAAIGGLHTTLSGCSLDDLRAGRFSA
jgi:cytochrome b pre-mRNA-processing protein 3